jgi:Flp pilus assembly pilin Flp
VQGRERDAGAGFVEYAGLMILIAGIFVMIRGLNLAGTISQAIGTAVNNVTGGG